MTMRPISSPNQICYLVCFVDILLMLCVILPYLFTDDEPEAEEPPSEMATAGASI